MTTLAPRLILSMHALQRCREMGLNISHIRGIVAHPEVTYNTLTRPDHETTYQAGPFAAVVDDITGIVITVLYRTQETYTRPEVTP